MSTSIFNSLCGESGVINQINEKQKQINQVITSGKNAINAVKDTINDIETLSDAIRNDPNVVKRRLQEEVFNILSREALANPAGAIGKVLALRAAYQEAGPAVERVLENVEQFIRDPLNTPLNLCRDIPNIVQVGDAFVDLGDAATTPDAMPTMPDPEDLAKAVGDAFITRPRFPTPDIKDAIEAAGRLPEGLPIGPGAADAAARGVTE